MKAVVSKGEDIIVLIKSVTRVFSQKSIMLQYVEGVHKNNPFICSICKETYIFKKVLDAHVKHAHATKKTVYKYMCTKCGKCFDNKAHYQIHADHQII